MGLSGNAEVHNYVYTMNTIKERFSNHMSTIRNGYDTTVARHFNHAHKIFVDPPFSIFVLEFIKLPLRWFRAGLIRVAPTYANLFMSEFETNYVYTYPKQPLMSLRYIDDYFMPWTHGIEELKKFYKHLNEASEFIKFTMEWSRIKVPFLDTMVKYNPDTGLHTDLYTRPTDTQKIAPKIDFSYLS